MRSVDYNSKDSDGKLTVTLTDGREISGEFFDGLRLQPRSIPQGKRLLFLRHGDSDWSAPVSVSPNDILVNYCGCLVVDKNIVVAEETDVTDYNVEEDE